MAPLVSPLPSSRLPDASSILVELTLVPRARAVVGTPTPTPARSYRILRTLDVDEYEAPIPAAGIVPLTAPRPAPSDNAFRGRSRRAAKLSIVDAELESFNDISGLIDTLPAHQDMVDHPDISTQPTNNRVEEERRNVRVKAFLYAASVEDDNDYHLIVGRDPNDPEMYMTVEISGLPSRNNQHFQALNAARKAYFEFFGEGLPGTSYDFYDPPIPVEIEGSLFFDASHATGGRPGPSKLRPHMPVVWEIHPVSEIVLEP